MVKRIGRAEQKGKIISKDLLVLSSEEEYVTCMPLLEKGIYFLFTIDFERILSYLVILMTVWRSLISSLGAAVYDSELLLNGMVIQKLEFERLVKQL